MEYVSLDGVMENPAWTMPFWSLFKDGAEARLTLTDSKTTPAGVTILTYRASRAEA